MVLDEQEFRRRADEALSDLNSALGAVADEYDFEVDFNAGALSIEFEAPPAKFVVSPNTPPRQIWVSAHARSFKLDWREAEGAFVHPDTGRNLKQLIAAAVSQQLQTEVVL